MQTRYREQKRFLRNSVLVLQIGFKVDESYNDDFPPSMQKIQTRWRDATVMDLILEDLIE
jgi:hypothetical protein